ncbi:MAG: hypothetical protein M3126_10710 [Candidatus Eremiobacteraeota bacterium]|nr:hypothetical protein [Candidatus Eremiobacteraeota bacterium]
MNFLRLMVCSCLVSFASGCAGPVEQWIVDTRVHQGDAALVRGSLDEAQLAYRLALKVDPANIRARAGYSQVATQIADRQYKAGHLDDALQTLWVAAKYDPQSVSMQGLRSAIEQAKIKREIVVSNYPTYIETGTQIQKSYLQLKTMNLRIIEGLKKFDYSYNIVELNKAIANSYELNLDVARNTNRLVAYRQLVESGVPAAPGTVSAGVPPASLLPLP